MPPESATTASEDIPLHVSAHRRRHRFLPGFILAMLATALLALHLMGGNVGKLDRYTCDDVGIIYTLGRMSWAEGAVAYRDFILDYGPTYFWYLGSFFPLAGLDSMLGAISLSTDVACWFLAPLGIYLVSWRLLRRSLPTWGALLLHLSAFVTFVDIRLVGVIYALLAIMVCKSRGPLLHAVIGAAVGVAYLTGIQGGIFPGYAYVLTMLYLGMCAPPRRLPWRVVAGRVAGMAAGLALVLGTYVGWYLLHGGRLDPLLYTWFVRGPLNSAAHQLPFLFGADRTTRLYTFCRLTPLLCLFPVGFLLFSDHRREERTDLLTWAVGILVVQIYALGRADMGHVCIGAALFAPALAFMAWNRHLLHVPCDALSGLFLLGWSGLVAAEFAVFFHNEALAKYQPVVILLAVLLVVARERLGEAAEFAMVWKASVPRWGLMAGALVPFVYLPLERVTGFANLVRDVARDPGAGIRRLVTARPPSGPDVILGMQFERVEARSIRRVCARINSDPAICDNPFDYIFPINCFLYNLLDARNPTPQFFWATIVSEREDRQTVQALEARRPPFAIFHAKLAPACSPLINQYVLSHYVLEETYGEYQLYRRFEGAPGTEGDPARNINWSRLHSAFVKHTPAKEYTYANYIKTLPGHPDMVFVHPPHGCVISVCRGVGVGDQLLDGLSALEIHCLPDSEALSPEAPPTVVLHRLNGRQETLWRGSWQWPWSRGWKATVPIEHPETIASVEFSSTYPSGTYWKLVGIYDGATSRESKPLSARLTVHGNGGEPGAGKAGGSER
jgi:hypothetical protein